MTALTPLIELASQRSLDLFFRVGQGYLVQSIYRGQPMGGHGLTPLGVQARAEARIMCRLGHVPHDRQPYAWPGGPHRPQPSPIPA